MLPEIVLLRGYQAFFEKPEEPFAGGKSHDACIETLLFNPEPAFLNSDSLLLFSVLFFGFKSLVPPVSGFCPFRPLRFFY